jgi:alkanesulfonate monooxygenase SsuD/methylene tetrahydromethanopterin reductase-like flavin-dependent oxidoreductase (luciferase family)
MKTALMSFWQHGVTDVDDHRFVMEEMKLALSAETLGFDIVAMPEHHFEDYSMAADSISALTYIAARTSTIELLTAVIVLPWHDPVRVAERILQLDHLSEGRALFGIGRGLAPREYAAFKVDQNEARERFDEMGPLLVDALETGVLEGSGPFYPYEPIELRPRPFKSFKDRLYGVSNSPSSAQTVAKLGARQMLFVASPLEDIMPNIQSYRTQWSESHGDQAPAAVFCDFTFCSRDPTLIERARDEWYPSCWNMTLDHYDLRTTDFATIKGYESHAGRRERAAYSETQIWGTPEEIVDAWEQRLDAVGDAIAMFVFRFGGMPIEIARKSLQLFSHEVLPHLRTMSRPAAGKPPAVRRAHTQED